MSSRSTELFIILTLVSCSAALYCLSCTDSISPRHCHTVRKCSDGEVCFTESHNTENGAVVYDTGCATSQTCRTKRAHPDQLKSLHGMDPHYHHSQCMECCTSHLCNNQGCGQPGYPMTRGPTCFDCQQVSDPMICDKIKVCEINQVCYLQKEIEFGDFLFTSSCINKHACTSDVDVFGKRNLQSCSRCCLADLCNNECGDMTTSTTTSSLTSATTVTPSTTQPERSTGTRGSEFLILFMKNHPSAHGTLTVYITSNNVKTVKILTSSHLNANITPVINFTSDFKLVLPLSLVGEYFIVEPKGLILQTSELSTVTIFDSFYISTNDGTLIIPTKKLSNKYIVSSTDPLSTSSDYYSQFAVGALYNRTTVKIALKFKRNTPLTIQGKTYRDGDIFTVMLERFDILQIAHTTDLSGSFITSTKPIAVFSGNRCQELKMSGCSHMVTRLPPTTEIDTQYIVPSFYNNAWTLIQVLNENRSSINFSVGNNVSSFHLNEKEYKNIEVPSNRTTIIESDQPALVTAFGMGNPYNPYMTVVPGIHQYLDYYKIIVPAGYKENFICVIVPSQSLNNIRMNGLSAIHYTTVYHSEVTLTKQFSIRTFNVGSGTFVLSTTDSSQFGLIVYGHRSGSDGYGFAGNFVNP